jgi:GalNAc-alpha-(1->4)-GalNAc-alpha-(1->3)-diNAcBac-PP-undecaprenol alpha-1,4-N-acetyl-D-galactosaminyltransferase
MIETDEQKSSLPAFPAVAIVVSGLGCGGAEKAAVSLANFLVEEGFPVTLMSFEKSGVEPFFSVDPRVTVLNLDLARDSRNVFLAVRNNLSRVLKIRGAIRKAKSEVVVSFMDSTNALTFFANIFSRIPVVLCERSLLKRNASGLVWRALVRISYIAVAARLKQGRIIFQSPAQLDANLTRLRHSIAFIPNAIELPAAALRKAETNVLVAVGRLAKEKRFEKLLEVFSLVRESVPETELRIVGDGPERPGLEARICELGLTGSVRLMGRMREPEVFLAGASLFINTSEYEGFPNALCEAMAAAIPPVSFHCPGAIGEIIDSGRNGVLVANDCKFAMAEAIIRLLRDESVREQLGTAARETMKSYSPAIVYGRWKEELLSVLDRRVETGTNSEGPLHICLLIRRLETGGAERQAVALANYLVNRGVRVTLMTFYPKHPGCGFHVDERVVQVCLKKRGIGDFPFFLINLRKELARMKPHVVYTFMEGANICGALSRIGSRAGFTLVWGIRSSDNRAGAYGRVRRLARLCESLLAGLPDAIFCNSAAGMRESKARAFPVRKIALVRNGVDIAAFDSRAERATVRNRFGLSASEAPSRLSGGGEGVYRLTGADSASWIGGEMCCTQAKRLDCHHLSGHGSLLSALAFRRRDPQCPARSCCERRGLHRERCRRLQAYLEP